MITTAGTVEAASRALLERGCRPGLVVAATHGLFVGPAFGRLDELPLEHVIVSDTVPEALDAGIPLRVVGIGDVLATAIRTLSGDDHSSPID